MKKTLSVILALTMVFSLAAISANADGAQEITYSLYSQPDGIDPGITNNSFASDILANAFEGLMTYDTETGSLICGEAESYTVSDDGLVYTFTLRDGLKWSDGSDHTAADYVYAIKRILDPATGAKYVDLVAAYIAGAAEYYAGETDEYVAGEQRVVTEWRGVRFLLQVCYDLRFPVFSRNRGDYDAIIYVANWPARRREVWQTLLKARALENQCFVVGVNIVGSDKACEYQGDSVVINAYGHTIASCASGMVEVAMAELDMDELQRFRKKFPVLEDGDNFNIDKV